MTADLFSVIESDEFAGKFYIASNTTAMLNHWVLTSPPVLGLSTMAREDEALAEKVASRATALFRQPLTPNYRSEYEAAICAYAIVLVSCQEHSWKARVAVAELDVEAGLGHGALRRLLDRWLSQTLTAQQTREQQVLSYSVNVSFEPKTELTKTDPYDVSICCDTPFDLITTL